MTAKPNEYHAIHDEYHTLLDHERTSTMCHVLTNPLSRAPVNVQSKTTIKTLHVSLDAWALALFNDTSISAGHDTVAARINRLHSIILFAANAHAVRDPFL